MNFPESWRDLGHVTPTILGSMVGYPSDSLASCSKRKLAQQYVQVMLKCLRTMSEYVTPRNVSI